MDENKIVALETPGAASKDALTEVLRQGAWRMLAQTVEAEVEAFVAAREHIRDEEGRRLVVRNGYLPERTIQSGIGAIAVKAPRVRDRSGSGMVWWSEQAEGLRWRLDGGEAFVWFAPYVDGSPTV